jgi:phenylacetate 2-hydroxylase
MIPHQLIYGAYALVFYAIVKYLTATDVPKIKNLPEIPGVPIFGNLIQLGTDHARVAQRWVKKYGPVFQTRLGNKVSSFQLRLIS